MLIIFYYIIILIWLILETLLTIKKGGKGNADIKDKGTMKLMWLVNPLSLTISYSFQFFTDLYIPGSEYVHLSVGIILIIIGIIIRYTAVFQLGQYFCMKISVTDNHKLVKSGLFRYMRHPSYTGLAISFLGFGISVGNWISLLLAIVPTTAMLLYRIKIEEAVLSEMLGDEYENYCAHTKRLIPFVY